MTADDRTLDRIRKILAMAEDAGATEAERDAFNGKAAEMIARYGIDRAMLAATGQQTDTVADRIIDVPAPFARDKADLLTGIAQVLRCEVVNKTRRRDGRTTIHRHLFGMASDLDRVDVLYTSLLVQAAHGMAVAEIPSWENPAAYKRSWLAGFTDAVVLRLYDAEQRAEENVDQATTGGPSVALVLADRSTLVKSALEETYPKLPKAKLRLLRGSGDLDGWHAGERADLGGPAVTGQQRKAVAR